MGINIPTKEELIANHLKADQLAQQLGKCNYQKFLCKRFQIFYFLTGAASLIYLSVEGLKKTVQTGIKEKLTKKGAISEEEMRNQVGHCTACLTGQYPVKLNF